jgi:hypothetical protein
LVKEAKKSKRRHEWHAQAAQDQEARGNKPSICAKGDGTAIEMPSRLTPQR